MECRRDLDVVGTALPKEAERHASPVCVGAGVRTKARSTSTDGALQRKPPTLPTSINGGFMAMKCRPCLRRGIITELPVAWQQSGRFECEDCAETVARKHKWTVVPLHKQGYSAFSREAARDVVRQLNPKRGGL